VKKRFEGVTKESKIEETRHLKSPPPSLSKRGMTSLQKREVKRDFVLEVYTIVNLFVTRSSIRVSGADGETDSGDVFVERVILRRG